MKVKFWQVMVHWYVCRTERCQNLASKRGHKWYSSSWLLYYSSNTLSSHQVKRTVLDNNQREKKNVHILMQFLVKVGMKTDMIQPKSIYSLLYPDKYDENHYGLSMIIIIFFNERLMRQFISPIIVRLKSKFMTNLKVMMPHY